MGKHRVIRQNHLVNTAEWANAAKRAGLAIYGDPDAVMSVYLEKRNRLVSEGYDNSDAIGMVQEEMLDVVLPYCGADKVDVANPVVVALQRDGVLPGAYVRRDGDTSADVERRSREAMDMLEKPDKRTVASQRKLRARRPQVAGSAVNESDENVDRDYGDEDDAGFSEEQMGARSSKAQVEAILWVSTMLSDKSVSKRAAPSAMAYNMLKWAQKTSLNEAKFWDSMFPRVMPSKAQIDNEARLRDGGEDDRDLLDAFERSVLR